MHPVEASCALYCELVAAEPTATVAILVRPIPNEVIPSAGCRVIPDQRAWPGERLKR